MGLPAIPTRHQDSAAHRQRIAESVNGITSFQFDDSRVRTQAEITAGVTPVNYAYEPGNVLRYGADNHADVTLVDSAAAIRTALLCNERIYFPPGFYIIGSTIEIHGDRVIITGEHGGTLSALSSRISYNGSGSLFDATGTEFGGVYIGHLWISGGSGDGEPCIISTRPQSVFERIHMEEYDNPGIVLSSSTVGSFGTTIKNVKWATVSTPTDYTGFEISINGGHVELYECAAINGNIGILIHQGQAIRIIRPSVNKQNANTSTENDTVGQCGIKITGSIVVGPPVTLYKQCVTIEGGYVEACANGLRIESCESCQVSGTIFQDLGFGTKPSITILNGDAQNVTLEHLNIAQANAGATAILNGSGNKVVIRQNYIDCYGGGSPKWLSTTTRVDYGYNRIISSASLDDPNGLAFEIEPTQGTWTPGLAGSTTPGTQTYSVQQGLWYRHGRRVTVDFSMIMTAKDAATAGNLLISGLPFTSRNNAGGRIYSANLVHGNLDLSAGKTQAGVTVQNNATTLGLYESGDNVALAILTAAALQATTSVYGTVSYEI